LRTKKSNEGIAQEKEKNIGKAVDKAKDFM
jgi:hypothetical protein